MKPPLRSLLGGVLPALAKRVLTSQRPISYLTGMNRRHAYHLAHALGLRGSVIINHGRREERVLDALATSDQL